MSHALNVYRSTYDLELSELLPPAYGDLPPSHELDLYAINTRNTLAFLRFDAEFAQLSGGQKKLDVYAATQENLAQDREQPVEEENPVLAQIQDEVKSEINEIGSKVKMPLFLRE